MADQPTRVTARSAVTTAGVTSAALLLAAAAAIPAFAGDDSGSGSGHSNNGNHYGQAQDHPRGAADAASASAPDDATGHNPPGNNGTVKIHDDYGDTAHHNVPHVDCDFAVAFWGFDLNQKMDVSFAGQAPTGKDMPLTVTGATTSISSPDDAGGGQDYDSELDFRADQLNLDSLGAPHLQQGYHIKLTVDTYEPGGHKYKVFWLQPCTQPAAATEAGSTTETPTSETPTSTSVFGESTTKSSDESTGNTSDEATTSEGAAEIPTEVLGRQITRKPTTGAAPAAASLPFTGAEIGGMAAAAALALGAGTALTVAGRRRRRTAGAISES
jgi:hypothetical protein